MFTNIKRVGLLILSSFAIMVMLGIVLNVIQYFFNIRIDTGNYQGLMIISVIFGFGSAIIGLWTSRWTAKRAYGVILFDANINDPKLQIVYQVVDRIAQQQGIKIPEVGYYKAKDANAFATGASKNSALVAVSTGLIQTMNEDAIRGVVGHEMAHILNGDMVTSTLLQGILNTLVIFVARILAGLISGAISDDENGGGIASTGSYFIISTILDVIFGLGVTLILMWHSRRREFAADAGSAEFLGSKQPMLDGLRSLQRLYDPTTIESDGFATLKISGKLSGLFASHPSIESRIVALQNT